MKKLKFISVTLFTMVASVVLSSSSIAGTGEKSGEIYYYQGIYSEGIIADYAYSSCDPCNFWDASLVCNCREATGKYPAGTFAVFKEGS